MSSISEHNESDNIKKSSLWWLKSKTKSAMSQNPQRNVNEPVITSQNKTDLDISSSIDEFLEKDAETAIDDASEADIGSIIEEINKLASQSPIGVFETPATDKSVEEILQEAEKLYLESSKSFEQLSSRSRSSVDYSMSKSSSISFKSKKSTPSPKSSHSAIKFTQEPEKLADIIDVDTGGHTPEDEKKNSIPFNENDKEELFEYQTEAEMDLDLDKIDSKPHQSDHKELEVQDSFEEPDPEDDIEELHQEIEELRVKLKETQKKLDEHELSKTKQSHIVQQQLEETVEQLKDTKEQNTVLQVQLDNLTKTHQQLKLSYEELLASKKNLEIRLSEIDTNFLRCKSELVSIKENNAKLLDSEGNLKKQLEIEKLQSKTSRLQNEKDAKCILDLNRQVKEMERIIQRKHPDSVSALIVASNKNDSETNLTARSLLENRIKQLENEANLREARSNNVFSEIQEKFNQMKAKYESHIEDLEIHVNDLKNQLKSKTDTYDIYTQTYTEVTEETPKLTDNNIKDVYNIGTQTEQIKPTKIAPKKAEKTIDSKEDTHLLATIRGLQSDLTSKEKQLSKMHKELEEMRKTNRKLQKERETNLKGAAERKGSQTYEKQYIKTPTPETPNVETFEGELKSLKDERDKVKSQLCRLEDDYQNLKTKRLQDLNILQEAHEREITTYMSNIGPMREQLDVQQISINNLQSQLATVKEELAIITVERDHLDARLKNLSMMETEATDNNPTQVSLQKKIAYLERRYEEREHRLRAIVHGLAQKQVTARDCAQCAARQQQLIGYKAELDQLLATLRYLQ